MKKRVISVVILSMVLAMAPAAMAQCLRCRPNRTCTPVTSGGWDFCYYIGPDCIIGESCSTLAATLPLASEYEVASVERSDEPRQPSPNETRIASVEAEPAPAAQR